MLGRDIRELVIVKMEEHTPFGDKSGETLLAGGDVLSEVKPIYSYIDATLHEAADEAMLLIPIARLTPVAIDGMARTRTEVVREPTGEEHIVVPSSLYEETYHPFTDGESSDGQHYGRTVDGIFYRGWINQEEDSAVYTLADMEDYTGADVYVYNNSLGTMTQLTITIPHEPGVPAEHIPIVISEYGREMEDVEHEIPDPVQSVPDGSDNCIGTVERPSDYLRLHTLQMAGWSRPVHETITPGHTLYNQQFSRWQRGHQNKPIVTDDGSYLHYYSQPASATKGEIKTMLYIPHFDEETDYPKDVAEVIAIHTAGKVFETFALKEQVELIHKQFESVLSTMQL